MARTAAPDARDRILETAGRLFGEHGVRAVGLQQVIDECNCGKSLLYREFASKDELVVAWLERASEDWECTLAQSWQGHATDPGGRLVELVRLLVNKVIADGGRGCPLRNTRAEFPDAEHPAHQQTVAHLRRMRDQVLEIARATSAADPDTLGDRITLIIDGVYTNGTSLGDDGAASAAIEFAADVVRGAIRGSK